MRSIKVLLVLAVTAAFAQETKDDAEYKNAAKGSTARKTEVVPKAVVDAGPQFGSVVGVPNIWPKAGATGPDAGTSSSIKW